MNHVNRCEQCGTPLLRFTCDDCDGYGYHWRMDASGEWQAVDCHHCAGTGKRLECTNTFGCPDKKWYPACWPGREAVRHA